MATSNMLTKDDLDTLNSIYNRILANKTYNCSPDEVHKHIITSLKSRTAAATLKNKRKPAKPNQIAPAPPSPTPSSTPASQDNQIAPAPPLSTPSSTPSSAPSRRASITNIEQTIAQEALSAHAASFRVNGSGPQQSNSTTERVGLAVIEPFVINSRSTLGFHLFGKKWSRILFSLFRGPLGIGVGMLFAVGMIVPCFSFLGFLPYNFSYVILCAMPAWVGSYSVLNVELLRQLFRNFDSILLLVYSTFAVLGLIISLRDQRIIMAVVGLIGLYNIILFDAAPEKWRKLGGKVGTILCFFVVVAITVSIFFEKIPDLHLSFFTVGKTTYSSVDISFLSCLQVIIFYIHQISNLFMFPQCFSLLTSRMKSVKVHKKSAEILTTVHERLNVDTKSTRSRRKSKSMKPFNRSKDETEQMVSDKNSSLLDSKNSRDSSKFGRESGESGD
ncbi:hypothetical protein TrST_g6670 [Triparma strigata]|uniref:Uncharacterized protein n=1 Tax=Triparma strigata TaxID=1606541 RepID=A0A9W7BV21_9STRA|nr:hypothetical protein TrST_g6670 [Triparma strigata]